MRLTFTGEPQARHRIGLDAEALPMVSWHVPPTHRHALCFAYGDESDVQYIETRNRRPGRFAVRDLKALRAVIASDDTIVVGHNAARYDLPLLNGVLIAHDIEPLPIVRVQDTMGEHRTGYAFRNTLSAQCRRYGVQLKSGGPDWDRVMMGDRAEWLKMRAYNVNDVVCALQLERALSNAGLPCAIRTWRPTKDRTR